MASPTRQRKLLVLTGKGGVGKTTVSAALGLLAADRGLRTIVVEVGDQRRLGELFGIDIQRRTGGRRLEDVELRENLWSISIDPDRALHRVAAVRSAGESPAGCSPPVAPFSTSRPPPPAPRS